MTTSKVSKFPEHSLTRLIVDTFHIRDTGDDFMYIFSSTISYLSGYCTAFDYQHAMKPMMEGLSLSAKDFRLKLHSTHYLSLSLKMFVFNVGAHRIVDASVFRSMRKELSLCTCDSRHISYTWTNFRPLRMHVRRVLREIPVDMKPLLKVCALKQYFNEIHAPIMRYVRFKAYSKLRFIASTSNCELSDLQNEIMLKVAKSFYSMLPLRTTEAHTINYLKRCAHNCAMNIIESETTQKRGRLVNVGLDSNNQRVFSLLVMSENQIAFNPDNPEATYDDLGTADDQISRFELEFSVSEVLHKYKKHTKKYRLLCILMGNEDKEFTEYLRRRNLCRDEEDNSDVQLRVSTTEYYKLLSKFLHVREDRVNVFMMRVAKSLALPVNKTTEAMYG